MTDKPPEGDDKEAEDRFDEVLGRLAKMPPKPHEASAPVAGRKRGRPPKEGREPKPAPKASPVSDA